MSQSSETVITLQALDGTYEVAGVDRGPGVWPENVEFSYNQWLCDQASFDLHRDPKVIWPDLRGGGLVEIEEGGKRVWKGRIKQTPSRDVDRVMSVQCEGMQYHLDDDLIERKYVHTKLAEWRDSRSFLDQNLSVFTAGPSVNNDRGAIVIGYPNGCPVFANSSAVGATLDFGPGGTAKRVVLGFENSGFAAGFYLLQVRGHDTPDAGPMTGFGSDVEVICSGDPSSVGSPRAQTFTTARRYVTVLLYRTGVSGTESGDRLVRITSLQVFADAAYESGNQSVLKASTIFTDALDRGTLLLSSDRSQIQVPTFSIPDFAPDRPRTPRELIEAGNAWQDWLTQIDVYDVAIFKPKPTAPRLEVGAWSPMEPDDSSQNSLEDIYNGVIGVAAGTDGSQLRVRRSSGQAASQGQFVPDSSVSQPNPSFDTNTTGWTISTTGGPVVTLTRDTVVFDSSPASGRINFTTPANSAWAVYSPDFTGIFREGFTYGLALRIRDSSAGPISELADVSFGVHGTLGAPLISDAISGSGLDIAYNVAGFGSTFASKFLIWSPQQDYTSGVKFRVGLFHGAGTPQVTPIYVDTLLVTMAKPTLIDRRNQRRRKALEIGFTLPTDGVALKHLCDTWLTGHKLTPFKGQVKLTGPSAVRDMLTGQDVPLEHLGLYTGQMLAFNDRADPDTAGHGRDARMVAYKYNKDRDEGVVTLDNTKSDFEALLARLAVVTGQGA